MGKTMQRIGFFLILFLVAFGMPLQNHADALSCTNPLFTESFATHDLLLHGTLVEKKIESENFVYRKMATLTFDTIKVYKGQHQDTFTIRADLTWDDHYRVGGQYVIFADMDGDRYLRDLCVPDYVASPSIIEFLDGYPLNLAVGAGVGSLYDLVGGLEKDNLGIKIERYSNLNRGDIMIKNIMEQTYGNRYSCNFVEDLKDSSRLLANVTIVRHFNDENRNSTVTFEYDNKTSPPIAVVNFEGEMHQAKVFVMHAVELGNCFAVYDSQLIDKKTNEVLMHHNNLETLCLAEGSHNLLPDLCPQIEEIQSDYMREGISLINALYIAIAATLVGVPSYLIYKKRKN